MREGWISHRFDEVFDLQMGKTPARDNPSYWGEGNIWVSIADMKDMKYISSSKEQITDVAVRECGIKPVKKGTAIMSFKLSIGKAAIASTDLFTNEAIMSFSVKDGHLVKPEFIYYFLKGYKWAGANKAVMGFTLNKKTIASNIFSYPSIAEQGKIVAELDCLSGIIEKKKQQLKELDNLAQSIFYDMFGDPITNEKGWETNKLGDVCDLYQPKTISSDMLVPNGKYLVYGANGVIGRYNEYNHEKPEVLMTCRGATCGTINVSQPYSWINGNAMVIHPKENNIGQSFLKYLLQSIDLSCVITGAAQPQITRQSLKPVKVFIPIQEAQNLFAQKMEAIEKQKELIKKSIQEAETLLNSRMDYWFN